MQAGSDLSGGLGRDDFPRGYTTFYDTKKRVWERLFDEFALFMPVRITDFQLCEEMTPFIFDLT